MTVFGLYWASYTTAIQHYSWEDLRAGEGIEPASPASGNRTRVRWQKQNNYTWDSNPRSKADEEFAITNLAI